MDKKLSYRNNVHSILFTREGTPRPFSVNCVFPLFLLFNLKLKLKDYCESVPNMSSGLQKEP